jgi:ACR3 family arsenite transporter
MGTFEKYLTFWVILCILVGIVLGHFLGEQIHILSDWNISTVNVPVAILVWFMIYPMMVQIDFSSIRHVSNN